MRLKRDYKIGTLIKFKWYDNWRDEYENPDNFRVEEGIVQDNTYLDDVIVYNGHNETTYAVPNHNILRVFDNNIFNLILDYEATN